MKNLKEFKELIKRYETIQLPEIETAFNKSSEPANILTGCGSASTCTLCMAVKDNCSLCVYGLELGCHALNYTAEKTYWQMVESDTPEKLLTAYRKRAKFMRELLKEKGVDDGTGS